MEKFAPSRGNMSLQITVFSGILKKRPLLRPAGPAEPRRLSKDKLTLAVCVPIFAGRATPERANKASNQNSARQNPEVFR